MHSAVDFSHRFQCSGWKSVMKSAAKSMYYSCRFAADLCTYLDKEILVHVCHQRAIKKGGAPLDAKAVEVPALVSHIPSL